MASSRVLCVGEALIDVIDRDGSTEERVGGSPLNVACGLAALGHPTELATCIGRDAHGDQIADHLGSAGVQLTLGSREAASTSVAHAKIASSGAASYCFDIDWQLPDVSTSHIGHLHAGSIAALLEPGAADVRQLLASAGDVTVSYDPNARPDLMGDPAAARKSIEELVALSDVVKASDEDVAWFYQDESLIENADGLAAIAEAWLKMGAILVVITRGAHGAVAWLVDEPDSYALEPLQVDVADTVGAGDSFMAGLLSGLLDAGLLGHQEARASLREARWSDVMPALDRAARTSASTVTKRGAYSPSRAELADS